MACDMVWTGLSVYMYDLPILLSSYSMATRERGRAAIYKVRKQLELLQIVPYYAYKSY